MGINKARYQAHRPKDQFPQNVELRCFPGSCGSSNVRVLDTAGENGHAQYFHKIMLIIILII